MTSRRVMRRAGSMALCRFSLRVDEIGAGIHRVIIVPLAEIQSGPLRERDSADARKAEPPGEEQFASLLIHCVTRATPSVSITVLPSGGIASWARRFIRATITEASAFPGATILALGIPSVSRGTTSQALLAAKDVV